MSEPAPRRLARFVFLTDDPATPRYGRYAWRLVAANNRPLGRAAAIDLSVDACRSSAESLREHAAVAPTQVALQREGGAWTWRFAFGSGSALSVHSYPRRIECHRAFTQFLDALASAAPADAVVRSFGPATLRSYEPVAAELTEVTP